jgi:hypothetical protein
VLATLAGLVVLARLTTGSPGPARDRAARRRRRARGRLRRAGGPPLATLCIPLMGLAVWTWPAGALDLAALDEYAEPEPCLAR